MELVTQLSVRRLLSAQRPSRPNTFLVLIIYDPMTVLGLSDGSRRRAHIYMCVIMGNISERASSHNTSWLHSKTKHFFMQGENALILNPFAILRVELCNGM